MEAFKKKTEDDLKKLIAEKRSELRKFRFEMAGSRIKNTKDGRNHRREIARIMTELAIRKNAPKAE